VRNEWKVGQGDYRLSRNIRTDKWIPDMTTLLNEKDAAFKVMQQEFAVIKDFRVSFIDLELKKEFI
jgi:hypothetical protein